MKTIEWIGIIIMNILVFLIMYGVFLFLPPIFMVGRGDFFTIFTVVFLIFLIVVICIWTSTLENN